MGGGGREGVYDLAYEVKGVISLPLRESYNLFRVLSYVFVLN